MKRFPIVIFLLLVGATEVGLCAAGRPKPSKARDDLVAEEKAGIDLDEAVFLLDEAKGEKRVQLIKTLAKMNDPRVAEALLPVIADPKPEDNADLQDLVYRTLYRLRNPAIVPELRKMLESGNDQRVAYALQLLGRTLGPKSFEIVKPFLESEGVVQAAAIKAMADTGSPEAARLLNLLLKRLGPGHDATVFIRMSLIRLGDESHMNALLKQYDEIIATAFTLKCQLRMIDHYLKKQQMIRRINYLWSVQRELRQYFEDLPANMVPTLVAAVESVDADSAQELIFEMIPRMMDVERAPKFAPALRSRFIPLRELILREYRDLNRPELLAQCQETVRHYLKADLWLDRRFAVKHSSLLPPDERIAALRAAAEDANVWVRAEAARELGRVRTPEALALIAKIHDSTDHDELRYICRCAREGLEEDLHGIR